MPGRESKESNELFFVCSLVEYIARRTKNHSSVVVNAIGKEKLQHIYNLALIIEISDLSYEIELKYNIVTDTHILGESELTTLRGKQPIFVNALEKGLHA